MKNNREGGKDKIVFLDAKTLDYGDISFKEIEKLGDLKLFSNTAPSQGVRNLKAATFAIVNKFVINADLIGRLDSLRCICVAATGVNNVDLEAARKKNIAVVNVPAYSTESVVQLTFAFILSLAANLVKYNEASHRGEWSRSSFFSLSSFPVREIHGKTLGIIGYGAIGRRVAQVAKAFGMKVLVSRIPGRSYSKKEKRESFQTVVQKADFLTVHAPLSDFTRNLIDGPILRKMKPGSHIINMARGGIVNELALREALQSGHLQGAATDVLTQEPPQPDHPLFGAPNLLLTPHIGWASLEARRRLVTELALNIEAFQKGKKRNRIV